jgi:hypothetical protein
MPMKPDAASARHLLNGRGYNPNCPDCRRDVDTLTKCEAGRSGVVLLWLLRAGGG